MGFRDIFPHHANEQTITSREYISYSGSTANKRYRSDRLARKVLIPVSKFSSNKKTDNIYVLRPLAG